MLDPEDTFEYRWNPGTSGDWISYTELLSILVAWNQTPLESGFPAVSISKRPKQEPGAVCGDVSPNMEYRCARSPGHTWPHRDMKQKGTETCSWWRGGYRG